MGEGLGIGAETTAREVEEVSRLFCGTLPCVRVRIVHSEVIEQGLGFSFKAGAIEQGLRS
jgi:hypothetical protein